MIVENKSVSNKTRIIILIASIAIIVIGLAVLPYVINYYFSPQRLIKNTTAALEKLTGAKVKISSAKLSMKEGITFYNVSVFIPEEKMRLEQKFNSTDAKIFDAKALKIKLKRRNIFGLKFTIKAITVVKPKFHLVRIGEKGKWNWQMLFAGKMSAAQLRRKKKGFGVGPAINLENGQIDLIEISKTHRLFLGQINFAANAEPQKYFYRIRLKTWTSKNRGPAAFIDFNPRTGQILAGKMESISWENLELTLPKPYREFCKQYNLSGKIGIPLIKYESPSKSQMVLVLENVHACLAGFHSATQPQACQHIVELSELNGRLIFNQEEVIIDKVTGKFNGADCIIDGVYKGYSKDFRKTSFQINIQARNLICPDYTDPKQYPTIEYKFPWKLRCFFHDFKPKGKVDFDLNITKQAGSDDNFLLNGVISPKNTSAEYFRFPYRVNNITGKIKIINNSFKLVGLKGTSDGGTVALDGFISEPSKFSAVDIKIHTQNSPLNKKLFAALPSQYKKIWKMFNPSGKGNAEIILHRDAGVGKKWKREITFNLTNAAACYEKFRYPINKLTGTMHFSNDNLQLKNLVGQNGNAELTINGNVRKINTNKPVVKVKISAKNVPIDDKLISALPPQPAKIIRDCQLRGITDLQGTLHTSEQNKLTYKFLCQLKNITLCYKDFPYRIDYLTGQLTITPKTVTIDGAFARTGGKNLRAKGQIDLGENSQRISLKISADNIPIDSQLYKALTPAQQRIWKAITPSGTIKVRADLKRIKNQPWNWHLIIEPKNCHLQYKLLPTIKNLTGIIEFQPHIALFRKISGTIDKHPINLDGKLTAKRNNIHSEIKLTIEQMPITAGLLSFFDGSGLIEKLKWQPAGTIKCNFNKLTIEQFSDKTQRWLIDGQFSIKNGNIGAFDKTPVDCKYIGQIEWNQKRKDFAMAGTGNIAHFNWNERIAKHIKCKLDKKLGNPRLKIRDITGEFAGGEISGLADLNLSGNRTDYGIQLTLNNVTAAEALNLKSTDKPIRGKMRGEIYLLGQAGQKYLNRGGGTIEIVGAEIFKIPLMKKVYESIHQQPPNLASFHNGILKFTIEKYILSIQRIRLMGPLLSLVGYGRINLSNDRIKLYLISAPPEKFNDLPLLKELIQGAATELTEIEIHGTISKPIINARPLKNTSDILKAFIQGQ